MVCLIEVVAGVGAIRHRFLQVRQAARTQVRTFITVPFITAPFVAVPADADLGLVPLSVTPAGEPGAVLPHRSGLLDALDALFETVWRTARIPERPGGRSGG